MANTVEIGKKIQNFLDNNDKEGSIKIITENALKSKLNQLRQIESILEIDKYKLVFIGMFGSGKTTAINYLFDLTFETAKEFEEILFTAAGRTTLCEVIVKPTKQTHSFFEVEYITEEDLKEYIKDFCIQIFKRNNKDTDLSGGEMPLEYERAIKNITKLSGTNNSGTDKAIDKLNKCDNNIEKFQNTLLSELEITVEQNHTINFQPKANELVKDVNYIYEKKWIKDTYKKINLASEPGFSIPRKFTININENVFGMNSYFTKFHSIIDTRGITKIQDETLKIRREDLENHIIQDDTICLFTTDYNTAPNEKIKQLIHKYYSDRPDLFKQRFLTLVLPRNREYNDTIIDNSTGETAGTWEKAIPIKRESIINHFKDDKIDFIPENILFYDAKRHFDPDTKKPRKNKRKEILQDKEDFFKRVIDLIEIRKELKNEINQLDEEVTQLIEQGISIEVEKQLILTIKNIQEYSKLIKDMPFSSFFRSEYSKYHHMTMRAIHSRNGIYNDIKLLQNAREIIREEVKNFSKDFYDRIVEHFKELEEFDENLTPLCIQLEKFAKDLYLNFYWKLGQKFETKLEYNQFANHSNLWQELRDLWGQGGGYKSNVLYLIETKLKSIDSELKSEVEKSWKYDFIIPILNFLGIEYLYK